MFESIKSRRFHYYLLALLIRLSFAFLFIDQDDGPVFFDTAYDVVILHKPIYFEGSLQEKFNYLPLAYLAILPGLTIYYLLHLNNLYLKVFFLKIPFIIGDLFLPYLLSKKIDLPIGMADVLVLEEIIATPKMNKITRAEIFLLFNPFIIFTSSIKGQFDIIPVIFLIFGWRQFLEQKYWKSGMNIAIGTLMKQYGILFSVFIGLHILKKRTKQFHKFFLGHLIIAIPVLALVAYINLDGLIYHAISYHLGRPPSGYSFTSIFFYPITIFIRINYSSTYGILVGNLIIEIFQAVLIFSLIYLGYDMWQSKNELSDLLEYLMFGYLCFYFLNNVLWMQYFIIFLALWTEFKRVTNQKIKMLSIYWNLVCIPMTFTIRANLFTLPGVQTILGEYWFSILWVLGVSMHFSLILYFHRFKTNMFEFWYIRLLFTLEIILLPFHFLIMSNFSSLFTDVVFP